MEGERGGGTGEVYLSIQGTLLYFFHSNFLHAPKRVGGGGNYMIFQFLRHVCEFKKICCCKKRGGYVLCYVRAFNYFNLHLRKGESFVQNY